jgi:predicted CXXCH cytochrome family protein
MRKGMVKGLVGTVGLALALGVGTHARGGVPAEAKYLGSKMCVACHKPTHGEMVSGWAGSEHARALLKIEEAKVVADLSKAPFPKDKVAYVLGSGSQQQAFLDADMKVLPGKWVTKDSAWVAQEAVDAKQDCLGCHTTGYDPEAGTWKELGVGCEMCHGPGSAHVSSSDKKATIVTIGDLDQAHRAMVCGRCHSQGKSKDGRYPFAHGFRPGDDLDQSLVFAKDVAKGAMNAQYNELRFGGGKHLASGTVCVTCHDPHGTQPSMLRDTGNALCQNCHAKLEGPQHSEAALKSVKCAMCHMPNGSHVFVPKKG